MQILKYAVPSLIRQCNVPSVTTQTSRNLCVGKFWMADGGGCVGGGGGCVGGGGQYVEGWRVEGGGQQGGCEGQAVSCSMCVYGGLSDIW